MFWRASVMRFGLIAAITMIVGACAETQLAIHSVKRVADVVEEKPQARYKVGKPYQIGGTWYYPKEDYEYDETGIASWYGAKFHGRKTANGEIYDMNTLTAAHRTLPMPSYVRVTNMENGRSLVLKVNDRGPFARGRIIDISRRGSQLLGFQRQGTAKVRVQILADKSRALAFRMNNQVKLERVGTPITVKRLPKAKVSAVSLPPPSGVEISANHGPVTVAVTPPTARANVAEPRLATGLAAPASAGTITGKVSRTTVGTAKIFVQAGAFGEYANANRVQARLASVGPVKISSVLINGLDLYRVWVGPLASVKDADRILESVARAGYRSARIIVK